MNGFSMQIPSVETIEKEVVLAEPVVPEELKAIREQAEKNVLAVFECDLDSLENRTQFTATVDKFGMDSMHKSTAKNGLMRVSVGKLSESGAEGSVVSKGLTELNAELKDLDPSLVDFTKTGLFGKLFNPVRNYFARFEKAESVIEGILDSLRLGKEKLRDDNTTLSIEQGELRALTKKLRSDIEMAAAMDEIMTAKLAEFRAQGGDPDRARFVEEEILFPLRQRTMDMQQLTVVNHQGVIAMEVIQRNNRELIRGVDRAELVTVTALRTAVMVAGALYDQKIVLKKIQMLNETTNNMIAATSSMLKEQGAEIHKQSVEANISVDTLKTAFNDVMTALEDISAFKREVLPVLKQNIDQFKALADEGEKRIVGLERGSAFARIEGQDYLHK